jgi:hypothetical protein
VTLQGISVDITPAGPDLGQVERARQRLRDRSLPEQGQRTALWGCLGGTALALILALLTMNGLMWVLALGGAVATGLVYFNSEGDRGTANAAVENQIRNLDAQVERAVQEWRRSRSETEEHAAAARRDLDEIRAMLSP